MVFDKISSQMKRPTRRDLNRSPLLVFYEVTRACGLVCRHCRACAQTDADPAELNSAESRQLIEQLTQFPQPPMLVLTGGDPFCRQDIFDLVDHAVRLNLDVSITPSATPLVTRDAIRRLRDAGIHRLAISIDGADAKSHDTVRGVEGSFARSLDILKIAREFGIPTQVNTTITPDNLDQIERLAQLLSEWGIVLWSVFFLVPVGRADSAARLEAAQYELAFERLWSESKRQPYLIKTTEAPHFRRFALQRNKTECKEGAECKERAECEERAACAEASGADKPQDRPASPLTLGLNDGRGVMFVSHTGLIHPSGFMPILCGVFPLQSVVQVYQDSEIFRGLRDGNRLEGKCGLCEYRNLCGGSRARAYAVSGNPFCEEPDCVYEPPASSSASA